MTTPLQITSDQLHRVEHHFRNVKNMFKQLHESSEHGLDGFRIRHSKAEKQTPRSTEGIKLKLRFHGQRNAYRAYVHLLQKLVPLHRALTRAKQNLDNAQMLEKANALLKDLADDFAKKGTSFYPVSTFSSMYQVPNYPGKSGIPLPGNDVPFLLVFGCESEAEYVRDTRPAPADPAQLFRRITEEMQLSGEEHRLLARKLIP